MSTYRDHINPLTRHDNSLLWQIRTHTMTPLFRTLTLSGSTQVFLRQSPSCWLHMKLRRRQKPVKVRHPTSDLGDIILQILPIHSLRKDGPMGVILAVKGRSVKRMMTWRLYSGWWVNRPMCIRSRTLIYQNKRYFKSLWRWKTPPHCHGRLSEVPGPPPCTRWRRVGSHGGTPHSGHWTASQIAMANANLTSSSEYQQVQHHKLCKYFNEGSCTYESNHGNYRHNCSYCSRQGRQAAHPEVKCSFKSRSQDKLDNK